MRISNSYKKEYIEQFEKLFMGLYTTFNSGIHHGATNERNERNSTGTTSITLHKNIQNKTIGTS